QGLGGCRLAARGGRPPAHRGGVRGGGPPPLRRHLSRSVGLVPRGARARRREHGRVPLGEQRAAPVEGAVEDARPDRAALRHPAAGRGGGECATHTDLSGARSRRLAKVQVLRERLRGAPASPSGCVRSAARAAREGASGKAGVFRLAYLLGIRKGQLRRTCKRHVLISGNTWKLRWPGEETKNGEAHEV